MPVIMRMAFLSILGILLTPLYTGAQPPGQKSEPPPRGSFLGLQQAIELGLDHHPLVQEAGAIEHVAEPVDEPAGTIRTVSPSFRKPAPT